MERSGAGLQRHRDGKVDDEVLRHRRWLALRWSRAATVMSGRYGSVRGVLEVVEMEVGDDGVK